MLTHPPVLLTLLPIEPNFQFPAFPIEVAESVLDQVSGDDHHTRALQTCSLVCRTWYPRSRFHLLRVVHIKTRAHLDSFDDYLASRPFLGPLIQTIVVEPAADEPNPWMLLGTVPVSLFPRLPNVHTWTISNFQKWLYDAPDLAFHRSTLASLHACASTVERLCIDHLHFVSCSVFKKFIMSLRRLRHLECKALEFRRTLTQEQLFMLKSERCNRLSLTTIQLGEVNRDAVDVLLALTHSSLEHLQLDLLPNGAGSPGMLTALQLDLSPMHRLRILSLTIVIEPEPEATKTAFAHHTALLKTAPQGLKEIRLVFRYLLFHQLAGSVYIDDAYIESFEMLDEALAGLHADAVTLSIPFAKKNRIRFWTDILGVFLPKVSEGPRVQYSFPDGSHA